jgi:hypothetical protein
MTIFLPDNLGSSCKRVFVFGINGSFCFVGFYRDTFVATLWNDVLRLINEGVGRQVPKPYLEDLAATNVSASHPGFDSCYPSLHPETQESIGCHQRHRERNDSVHVAAPDL